MNTRTIAPATRLLFVLSLALGGLAGGCDRDQRDVSARLDPNGAPDGGADGCTLTQGYWKNHHAGAKNPAQQSPWPLPEEAQLCDQTWLDILTTPPKGDAWYVVAHQWIAASLNVAAGAVPPPDVAAALAQVEDMLADCAIDGGEHDAALAASEMLDNFNNGDVGPGHCGDDDTPGGDTTGDTTTGDGPCGPDGEGCETGDSFTTDLPIPQ